MLPMGVAVQPAGPAAPAATRARGMTQEEVVEALQMRQDAGDGAANGDWTDAAPGTNTDSWKDLYAVLVASLQSSSKHFESLTVETIAMGWLGLSQSHDGVRDDIQGEMVQLSKAKIDNLIHCARWATAFDAGRTPADLAKHLSVPVESIPTYRPDAIGLSPAYFIAVDSSSRMINIVVRGTTTWHDALTDLVAHTEPFFQGQAHSGMLASAKGIIGREMATLQSLLDKHEGYRIHCIGHSLGGGVAALLCFLLRNTPEHRAKLSKAQGVVATGYGTPPVMTRELADHAASYCRSLVHNHDMVPRASVHSLSLLRAELEAAADKACASNTTLAFLRDKGVITAGKTVVAEFFRFAASGGAARYTAAAVVKNSAAQMVVQAGLQLGASYLTARMRQMHVQAVKGSPETVITSTQSDPAPTVSQPPSSVSVAAAQACSATVAAVHSQTAAATTAAEIAAGTTAAAPAACQCELHAQQDAAAEAAALQTSADKDKRAEEEQAAAVELFCPGQLLYLRRSGTDAEASYELIEGMQQASSQRFGRIIINRSMLQDHYLTHYVAALQRLQWQHLHPQQGMPGSNRI